MNNVTKNLVNLLSNKSTTVSLIYSCKIYIPRMNLEIKRLNVD